IAKALVDIPDEVTVREVEGEQVTVLELRVAPSDLGKVIGKQGRTARSIRTLLGAAGVKLNRRVFRGAFCVICKKRTRVRCAKTWRRIRILGATEWSALLQSAD